MRALAPAVALLVLSASSSIASPAVDDVLMVLRLDENRGSFMIQDTAASSDACISRAVAVVGSRVGALSVAVSCLSRTTGAELRAMRCERPYFGKIDVVCETLAPSSPKATMDGRPFP